MSLLCMLLTLAAMHFAAAATTAAEEWNFEDVAIDNLPEGWSTDKTGQGPGSVWKVLKDESAPSGTHVLAQTSSAGPNRLFNLCVADRTDFTDVDIRVSWKAAKGTFDQGGGPVWRYQDADNYYVARANPLEDNYRVYKVVEGRRIQLGTAEVKAQRDRWYTIRIVQRANHIQCFLNGKLHLDVKDNTFKGSGKVGLWTKADAVTSFDGLSVRVPGE